jgi:FkbM family methyltransferase
MDRQVSSTDEAGSRVPLTDDAFLGGALHIQQPRSGYRAGLDAVMLAATVPTGGEEAVRVLDVGAGVGTAGLCVARRVAAAHVTLLERDVELARIAADNVERNGLAERVHALAGEVGASAEALRQIGLAEESFDHVIANPPFHDEGAGTPAPDALKARSHAMPEAALEAWARFMARMTAPRGSATMIHKVEALGRVLAVMNGRFGALKVLPLLPREDAPAHRVIVQGTKGSRAPLILLADFVLHGPGEAFTSEAQAILAKGAALPMATRS